MFGTNISNCMKKTMLGAVSLMVRKQKGLCSTWSVQYKATDLDGMPTIFYKHFWEIIIRDVISVVQSFFNKCLLLKN